MLDKTQVCLLADTSEKLKEIGELLREAGEKTCIEFDDLLKENMSDSDYIYVGFQPAYKDWDLFKKPGDCTLITIPQLRELLGSCGKEGDWVSLTTQMVRAIATYNTPLVSSVAESCVKVAEEYARQLLKEKDKEIDKWKRQEGAISNAAKEYHQSSQPPLVEVEKLKEEWEKLYYLDDKELPNVDETWNFFLPHIRTQDGDVKSEALSTPSNVLTPPSGDQK